MQKQPYLWRCVWCGKEKAQRYFPLKSNVPSPSFPGARGEYESIQHMTDGEQALREIDKLRDFLLAHYRADIGKVDKAPGESAVDIAIRLLTKS